MFEKKDKKIIKLLITIANANVCVCVCVCDTDLWGSENNQHNRWPLFRQSCWVQNCSSGTHRTIGEKKGVPTSLYKLCEIVFFFLSFFISVQP